MSDVGGPNTALEAKKLELEIKQLQTNQAAAEYRLLQLDDEREKVEENMAATTIAITEKEQEMREWTKRTT